MSSRITNVVFVSSNSLLRLAGWLADLLTHVVVVVTVADDDDDKNNFPRDK